MNIRSAIVTESTLSFMGVGLPLDVISWGSLLSLSDKALYDKILVDYYDSGLFLIVLLICPDQCRQLVKKNLANQKESNL